MVDEARLEETGSGLSPVTEGWYVLNLGDATRVRHDYFGAGVRLEGDAPANFKEIGMHVDVLMPGERNGLYHRESVQENFLVLSGECLLIVEGQERRLREWDFVHCPPGTNHIFVGAGDGPCTIFMLGVRRDDAKIVYPVDEAAARHGASVTEETDDPDQAYAGYSPPVRERPEWKGVPWA